MVKYIETDSPDIMDKYNETEGVLGVSHAAITIPNIFYTYAAAC